VGPAVAEKECALASFVARIWLERGQNGDPIWRGHIRGVQSGESTYFLDLKGLSEFLELISGAPGPPAEREADGRRRDIRSR